MGGCCVVGGRDAGGCCDGCGGGYWGWSAADVPRGTDWGAGCTWGVEVRGWCQSEGCVCMGMGMGMGMGE